MVILSRHITIKGQRCQLSEIRAIKIPPPAKTNSSGPPIPIILEMINKNARKIQYNLHHRRYCHCWISVIIQFY